MNSRDRSLALQVAEAFRDGPRSNREAKVLKLAARAARLSRALTKAGYAEQADLVDTAAVRMYGDFRNGRTTA